MEKKANNEVKKDKKNGVRFSLVWKITGISIIPLVILAVALTVAGMESVKSGMKEEIMSKLESVVVCMEASMNALDAGDYSLDDQNNLLKGSYNLTEHEEVLDAMVEGVDEDVTFFYDKTRRATTLVDKNTGERILGTDAGDEVYNQVVKEGKIYEAYDLVINDTPYYAYYRPMKNSDGTVVGMFFAGTPATKVNSYITEKSISLTGITLVIGCISLAFIVICVMSIRKGILGTNSAIVNLVTGDLTAKIDEKNLKRTDELGLMAREVKQLQSELVSVLSKVKESSDVLLNSGKDLSVMASQTSTTADEISHAVEDISKGAVSQADEIETASARIEEMGNVIGNIVNSVGALDTTSVDMKAAGDQSESIINDLSRSNDKTMEAIERIGKQVHATNESANRISEAIEIITSIAEETNLLSLNASIEAARAGEQGRGFAVVANQIQKLAEQSNESAQKIAEIIQELLADSEHTVNVMGEVYQIVNEQQEKLEQTKSQFKDVSKGIDVSRDETSGIKDQTTICDSARSHVVDVITNLSAISEENAASTQQTTASMQELNATINLLAESANNLTELSEALEEEIKFFRF